MQTVLHSLSALSVMASPNNTTAAPIDKEQLTVVVDSLSQQIANYDTGALETIENNRELLTVEPIAELSSALEKALEGYDFEAASAVCGTIERLIEVESR